MKTASRIILTALAFTVAAPGLAWAQEAHATTSTPRSAKVETGQVCARIGDVTGPVSAETTSRYQKLTDRYAERAGKINTRFGEVAAKQAASRTRWDNRRQEDFMRLEAKATTDAQKQAVAAFKASLVQATATRRAAVDAANAAFKKGILEATAARQVQLKAAATSYQAAVTAAVARAKASCTAGTRPEIVRQTLQTALKAARQNLQTATKNAEKVRPNLDPLKAAHKAAIEKANNDFKSTVQAALATLKTSFKSIKPTQPSPSATPSD